MPANTANDDEGHTSGSAESVERSFQDAVDVAERHLTEAARRAERVLREGVENLRAHTREYTGDAEARFDEAQRYVVERVKERPVTATLAGLGVGLLLGLLLAGRSNR